MIAITLIAVVVVTIKVVLLYQEVDTRILDNMYFKITNPRKT